MNDLVFSHNSTQPTQILYHLKRCDPHFTPPLRERVILEDYSNKIYTHAERFEAFCENHLVGLIAMYISDEKQGYITNVSVDPEFTGQHIASQLLSQCLGTSQKKALFSVRLDVHSSNEAALALYKKFNFEYVKEQNSQVTLECILEQ